LLPQIIPADELAYSLLNLLYKQELIQVRKFSETCLFRTQTGEARNRSYKGLFETHIQDLEEENKSEYKKLAKKFSSFVYGILRTL